MHKLILIFFLTVLISVHSQDIKKKGLSDVYKDHFMIGTIYHGAVLGNDKSNDRVRTPKVNAIFGSIPILSKEISKIKKGEPIPVNQFSDLVTATGVEPTTAGAEIQCSIQLSYAAFFKTSIFV